MTTKEKIKHRIRGIVIKYFNDSAGDVFFMKQAGHCPICDQDVIFKAQNSWLRDYFKCSNCGSIPRERALMATIKKYYPNWQNLQIHESSPSENRGHSKYIAQGAKNYLETQFFGKDTLGTIVNGVRSEDLENQTFDDNTFDLVITSDVMEHVYNPEKAFKEIHRTLKPGGGHIFSVPIINKHLPTEVWATLNLDGTPNFLHEPEWHGNPIDKQGSPVTMHWGFDIVDHIKDATGDDCFIEYINDLDQGIRAEYIEIVVARKK